MPAWFEKRRGFYENLINRSGHRHRVFGDIFRFNPGTNLVNPPRAGSPTTPFETKRGTGHPSVSLRNAFRACPPVVLVC